MYQVKCIFKMKKITKRGHLIAQVRNTAMEWSIKPQIVQTKQIYQGIETEIS